MSSEEPKEVSDRYCDIPTMPVDSFLYLKSCNHIDSVLASKAREAVFIAYRQAVMLSQFVPSDRIYKSKKDGSIVSSGKLAGLKAESLKCTDCSLNNFDQNFICLQCPSVGCYSGNNHAYAHFKSNKHSFGVDSSNGLLYCFICGNYVNNHQFNDMRMEVLSDKHFKSAALPQGENEMKLNYDNPSRTAVSGLRGFINLGSTCFMSCILQTFIHNPLMKHHFFNNDYHFFNCESNYCYNYGGSIDKDNACITCSIDNIYKNFYTSNSTDGFAMTNLLMTAWYKKKSLAGFEEQDAHEFLQFLLNEFHMDHEKVTKKLQENGYLEHSTECNCITHSAFSGTLESSIKCLSCQENTNTVDPMLDLSLEITKKPSKPMNLYDCLDLFTKEENLDVNYRCQHCGESTRALKTLRIKKVPPVLTIQLKRFEHHIGSDTSTKIEVPVLIPLFLNIHKYTAESTQNPGTIQVLELFALVCHVGSVNTGHYRVIVKNSDNQWLNFDDSVVSLVSEEDVSKTNAYLLFYIAHDL